MHHRYVRMTIVLDINPLTIIALPRQRPMYKNDVFIILYLELPGS